MALVLVLSFSGAILSSIVVLEKYHVESLDHLIQSNKTFSDVIVNNDSLVWWMFKGHQDWNGTLILGLEKLQSRLKYVDKV